MDILDDSEQDSDDLYSNSIEATEESENEATSDKSLPFDPKSIKITVETITVYGVAQRLKRKQIDLYPKFQRKANLWDNVRKSRLIESLLLRFPLPAFYFDIQGEYNWLVVDGLQRLSTLNHFLIDAEPLKLEGLEFLKDLEGKTFKQLDTTLRQRILDTNLTTFQIQKGTPKGVKYNLFKRINTGGLGLTPMEIRHALNQAGNATYFFETLGNENSFFSNFVKNNKIQISRMEDRELALRYVAYSIQNSDLYGGGLGKFLDQTMEKLDTFEKEACQVLIHNLERSVNCYGSIFGNTRFGRGVTRRARTSSALFETWTSELAKLTDLEQNKLLRKKDNVIDSYKQLLGEPTFQKAIVSHTSNKSAVETRFSAIRKLIQHHLKND
jgi:hypothetical protein